MTRKHRPTESAGLLRAVLDLRRLESESHRTRCCMLYRSIQDLPSTTFPQRSAMLLENCLPRIARVILLFAAVGLATYVKADSGLMITDRYAVVNGVKL